MAGNGLSKSPVVGLAKYDYCAMVFLFIGVARLRPLPRESIRAFGPGSPKEQPPRNLSGTKDRFAGMNTLESALPGQGCGGPPMG